MSGEPRFGVWRGGSLVCVRRTEILVSWLPCGVFTTKEPVQTGIVTEQQVRGHGICTRRAGPFEPLHALLEAGWRTCEMLHLINLPYGMVWTAPYWVAGGRRVLLEHLTLANLCVSWSWIESRLCQWFATWLAYLALPREEEFSLEGYATSHNYAIH